MPQVVGENGKLLDANYEIGTVFNLSGLILHSRSGNGRNPDYGKALLTLLERYWLTDLATLSVFVVSKPMLSAYKKPSDLAVKVDGQHPIQVAGRSPLDTYHMIGRAQEKLRDTNLSQVKGGNRNKRILLHHPSLSAQAWHQLATLVEWQSEKPDEKPQNDSKFIGNSRPRVESRTAFVYQRSAEVVGYVLDQARGTCEACFSPAPFSKKDGTPYLEVHHVRPLAEGGSDLTTNAIAVCPNCHRQFHHGHDRDQLIDKVINNIPRLLDERT